MDIKFYKLGEEVLYKDNKTPRRILAINIKGEVLLWGMYDYVPVESVTKII